MLPLARIEPGLLRGLDLRLWWLSPDERGTAAEGVRPPVGPKSDAGRDGPDATSTSRPFGSPDPDGGLALRTLPGGAEPTDSGQAEATLSDAERGRMEAFRFGAHRAAFLRRHAWLRCVLGRLVDQPAAALRFTEGRFGKPALQGPGPVFNLSHSEGSALLATAGRGALGVDVEACRPLEQLESVSARILHPTEAAAWGALAPGDRLDAFYRVWTRKESVLKATGEGLQRDPTTFAVGLEPRPVNEPVELELAGVGALVLVDLALPGPFVGALALLREGFQAG